MIAIDRIVGDRAVIDINGELLEIAAAALPPESKEGDLLQLILADASAVKAEGDARRARLAARSALPDSIDL